MALYVYVNKLVNNLVAKSSKTYANYNAKLMIFFYTELFNDDLLQPEKNIF